MPRIKKGYKRVYISVIFHTDEIGDYEKRTRTRTREGIWFDIPKEYESTPIHLYQYECENIGEEVLVKQICLDNTER